MTLDPPMTAEAEGRSPDERVAMTVSERRPEAMAAALEGWLATKLGLADRPTLTDVRMPEFGGLSSTSLLFRATWTGAGPAGAGPARAGSADAGPADSGLVDAAQGGAFVARMAPEPSAVPVFPRYDLPGQFAVISQVAALSDVPVPRLRWNHPADDGPFGAPFFVMDQVEGRVPLDNPPYVFTGWLAEASDQERDLLTRESVEVLARLHAIPDAPQAFGWLRPPDGIDPLRWHVQGQRDYYQWALAADGFTIPIIERGFDWLDGHWPAERGPAVLSWGDARIGNIIYDGFAPVAVLDWEMAGLAPREVDLGWFVFLHRFFQDIAEFFEHPGLPGFLRRSEVERLYARVSGHQPRDMDFYLTYAAVRHAIIMARIRRRMIHFGEEQLPDDPDDYVMHRPGLEKLLAGTYRWD